MPSKFGGIPVDGEGVQPPRSRFGGIPVEEPPGVQPGQQRPPPDPSIERSSAARQLLGDTGVSLLKGAIAVPESLVGLADMMSAGETGKLLERYGFRPKEAKQILDELYSPEHKRSREALRQAEGFTGTIAQAVQNPSTVAQAVIESVPSMLAGGAVARGLSAIPKAAQLSPLVRGAIGEGVVSGGSTAERIRQQTPTGTLSPGQVAAAAGSGMVTGALGVAGGKVAGRLGIADIDTLLAGGARASIKPQSMLARAAGGALGEGVLEELPQSAQEELLTNVALGRPAMEGVPQAAAMGMLAGGVAGGGVSGLAGRAMRGTGTAQAGAGTMPGTGSLEADVPTARPIHPPIPGKGTAQAQALERVQTQRVVQSALAQRNAEIPALLQAPLSRPNGPDLQPLLARPVPAQPAVPFAGSRDISPLLEKMGMAPEQRAQAVQLLAPVEPQIAERRRGTVSWEETQKLAELSGFTVDDLKKRRLGQPFNAEQFLQATQHTQQAMTRTLELQQLVREGQANDVQKAEFLSQVAELGKITAETMGARAEVGRSLSVMRKSVAGVQDAQRLIDAAGGATGVDAIAKAMQDAIDKGGVGAAAKLARNAGSPKFWDFYKAMLLTSPDTHIVNALSNTATALLQIPERFVAAGIAGAKRAAGLQGATRWREPVYQLSGLVNGAVAGMQAAVEGWKTGEPALGAARHEATTTDTGTSLFAKAQKGYKGIGWGLPFRALTASDNFFAMVGEGMERYALASRQAVQEAKSGKIAQEGIAARTAELINNPTDGIRQAANEAALYQTFNHKAGAIASKLMEMRTAHPSLNLIVPFIRTPANIISFALKRTPIAGAFKDVRADLMAGGARQEQAIARVMTGSLLGAAATIGAAGGSLSGGGPEDPREKAALLNSGWRPYSIKVGDNWYSYNRFEPFGVLVGLAADLQSINAHVADDEKANIAGLIALSVGRNLVSKTYMRGLTEAMQALSDPDRYGERWANRTLATVVQPVTLLAQVARETDEFQREASGLIDSVKRRVPGLAQTLPPRLDMWGAPMRPETRTGGIPGFGGPVVVGTPPGDPVRQEAARLGFAPKKPSKKITYQGQTIELTPGQYAWLQETAGRWTYIRASQIIGTDGWHVLPDEMKTEALNRLMDEGRTYARTLILADYFKPELGKGDEMTARLDALEAQAGIETGAALDRAKGVPQGAGEAAPSVSRFGGVPVQ